MKRLQKGSFILVSIMLSLVLVLAGCSKGNDKESGSSAASPAASSSSASQSSDNGTKALEPYEVVMVYPDNPQKDVATVQKAMNDYLKTTYPEMNMTVKLNPIDWGAWGDKTNLMMASGEKFDLFFTAGWLGYESQVIKGGLLPLDDLLAKYGPDIEAVEKDYHEAARRGGKIYGIHTHQELGNPQGLVLNKELVDKYKFDLSVLKSGEIKDLEPMLKTIKENEPGVTPYVGPTWPLDAYFGSGSLDGIIGDFGLYVKNTDPKDDYKVVNKFETPRFMDLATLGHNWFKAGYINKDGTTKGLDVWQKIKAKKAFATMWDMDIVSDIQIGVPAPMPSKTAQT